MMPDFLPHCPDILSGRSICEDRSFHAAPTGFPLLFQHISLNNKESYPFGNNELPSLSRAWLKRRFISPLQRVPKEQRDHMKRLSNRKYKKSFFKGTIGFGYFLGDLFAFSLLDNSFTSRNCALGAIFFIIAGTVFKAQELTTILVEQLIKKRPSNQGICKDQSMKRQPACNAYRWVIRWK